MIQQTTKPLNPLELLRIKKNPQTEREKALLANLSEAEKDHAADIQRWQELQIQMQMFIADSQRKMKCFVQMLSTMAIEKKGPITVTIADLKTIEGSLYEIAVSPDKKTLTFELKDEVLILKKEDKAT